MASAPDRESAALDDLPTLFDAAAKPTTRSLEVHTIAPLASVVVALHRSPCLSAQKVTALPHVVAAISDLTLSERWTIPRACKANLLMLLPYLAARYEVSRAQAQNHTRARDHGGDRRIPASADLYRSDPFFHALECRQGLVWAVAHDNLEMLEWLHAHCPSVLPYAAMVKAAEVGNLRLLQWLRARHPRAACLPEVMDAAAGAGQLEVLQWLQDDPASSFYRTYKAFEGAAANGHLETLEWLLAHYPTMERDRPKENERALRGCHWDVVKLLFEQPDAYLDANVDAEEAVNLAAAGGSIEMIEWLISQFSVLIDGRVVSFAARGGHMNVVKWLLERELVGSAGDAARYVASRGDLETIQWLHIHNHLDSESAKSAMASAAWGGSLHIVEWLYATFGEYCAKDAMSSAAAGGHLDIIKWLHTRRTEGCLPYGLDYAAMNGHLHVLEWIYSNRKERCSKHAIHRAATYGHLEVVKWLVENHGLDKESLATAMRGAVENDRMKIAKWLHERGVECDVRVSLKIVADKGFLGMIQWLHETHLDALEQLASDTTGQNTIDRAIKNAAQNSRLDIVLYLHARYGGSWLAPGMSVTYKWSIERLELMQWMFDKNPSSVDLYELRWSAWHMPALLEHVLGPIPPVESPPYYYELFGFDN